MAAASLEVYKINTQEEFRAVVPVLNEGYTEPLNTLWEVVKGTSDDELAVRFWQQWHLATPGSQWIGVRRTDGDKTIVGAAQWILHETNPFANGNPIPPGEWWSDIYLRDITDQVCNIFFGRRPKDMARPHVLLNVCCISQKARRIGAGSHLVRWGLELADRKGLETWVEATLYGTRLYESCGFTIIEPYLLDAKLPEKFKGNEEDKKAWLAVQTRVVPRPYPVVLMWRPKGADWKEGDKPEPLQSLVS